MQRLKQAARLGAVLLCVLGMSQQSIAAPYAAMVVDARSGKVLHSRNADTRLHPASLTKMMTLYVVFDAIRRGEITLDTKIKVSKNAAAEPASKLYLKSGQRIALRYLIRASAVKSANDAATAMGEAISGSEAAFAARMTRTAKALGMSKTTFKNAHGLTAKGHLSTARDMTTLGRALFYHYPEYYNLFSRRTTDAGVTTVSNTNRRLLAAYRGADGIKTGYTRAAGFNLVASAERGNTRIIATMFGGTSGASRNARVAELLDMGFKRAPSRVAVNAPRRPNVSRQAQATKPASTAIVLTRSARPLLRPDRAAIALASTVQTGVADSNEGLKAATAASTAGLVATAAPTVEESIVASAARSVPTPIARPTKSTQAASLIEASIPPETNAAIETQAQLAVVAPLAAPAPKPRPAVITFSSSDATIQPTAVNKAVEEVLVPHMSTSGGRNWAINVGTYNSRYEAERVLLKTALVEIETLDDALRKVVRGARGFQATFVGLDERNATLACQRLTARDQNCETLRP